MNFFNLEFPASKALDELRDRMDETRQAIFEISVEDQQRENLWDQYVELAAEEFIHADPTHPSDAARRVAEFADAMCEQRANRFLTEEPDEAE